MSETREVLSCPHCGLVQFRTRNSRCRRCQWLHGIPVHWRTDISEWSPPHRFVDEQTKGPYKLWRHTHSFEAHGSRTKMIDEVQYALPFGVLGRIVHALKVRRDVSRIFDYRRQQIDALFGQSGENAA